MAPKVYKYHRLAQLPHHGTVNIFGIVAKIEVDPASSNKIHIKDEKGSAIVHIKNLADLGKIEVGDVLRIHRSQLGSPGNINLRPKSGGNHAVVWGPEMNSFQPKKATSPNFTLSDTDKTRIDDLRKLRDTLPKPDPPPLVRDLSEAKRTKILSILAGEPSWFNVEQFNQFEKSCLETVDANPSETLENFGCLNDRYLSGGIYFNFFAMIISMSRSGTNSITITVWDGTIPPVLQSLGRMNDAILLHPTVTSDIREALVPYSVEIVCYGEWEKYARELKSGSLVLVANAHIYKRRLGDRIIVLHDGEEFRRCVIEVPIECEKAKGVISRCEQIVTELFAQSQLSTQTQSQFGGPQDFFSQFMAGSQQNDLNGNASQIIAALTDSQHPVDILTEATLHLHNGVDMLEKSVSNQNENNAHSVFMDVVETELPFFRDPLSNLTESFVVAPELSQSHQDNNLEQQDSGRKRKMNTSAETQQLGISFNSEGGCKKFKQLIGDDNMEHEEIASASGNNVFDDSLFVSVDKKPGINDDFDLDNISIKPLCGTDSHNTLLSLDTLMKPDVSDYVSIHEVGTNVQSNQSTVYNDADECDCENEHIDEDSNDDGNEVESIEDMEERIIIENDIQHEEIITSICSPTDDQQPGTTSELVSEVNRETNENEASRKILLNDDLVEKVYSDSLYKMINAIVHSKKILSLSKLFKMEALTRPRTTCKEEMDIVKQLTGGQKCYLENFYEVDAFSYMQSTFQSHSIIFTLICFNCNFEGRTKRKIHLACPQCLQKGSKANNIGLNLRFLFPIKIDGEFMLFAISRKQAMTVAVKKSCLNQDLLLEKFRSPYSSEEFREWAATALTTAIGISDHYYIRPDYSIMHPQRNSTDPPILFVQQCSFRRKTDLNDGV